MTATTSRRHENDWFGFVTSCFRGVNPNVVVPIAIMVAVAAMVAVANWRDGKRSRQPFTTAPPFGAAGAIQTSREALDRRVKEMEARLQAQPDDHGAAVLLADALLRLTRVTGNAGLALRAEQALKPRPGRRPWQLRRQSTARRAVSVTAPVPRRDSRSPNRTAPRAQPIPSTTESSATRASSSATTTKRSTPSIR